MIFLTPRLIDDAALPGLKIAPKSFRLVHLRWPTWRPALQEIQVGSRRMPTTHLTTPPLATRRNLHFCHLAMWCGALSKTLVLPQTGHRFFIVTVTFCDILIAKTHRPDSMEKGIRSWFLLKRIDFGLKRKKGILLMLWHTYCWQIWATEKTIEIGTNLKDWLTMFIFMHFSI